MTRYGQGADGCPPSAAPWESAMSEFDNPPPTAAPPPSRPPFAQNWPPPPPLDPPPNAYPSNAYPSNAYPPNAYPPAQSGMQPYGAQSPYGQAPIGKIRGTWACVGLSIITLGFYSLYWYFSVHNEIKAHSRVGLGGGVALLLALFVGIVMPFITSSEVGDLYERRGQAKPVSGATGLWSFPGILILVGPIVWFVKTNGALNDYWRSLGAID